MSTILPSRSDNLKAGLEYVEWELIETCLLTMVKGLIHKGRKDEAKSIERVMVHVGEILAALRAEGHV